MCNFVTFWFDWHIHLESTERDILKTKKKMDLWHELYDKYLFLFGARTCSVHWLHSLMAVFSVHFSVFHPVEKEEVLLYTLPQSCYHRALPLMSACDMCLKLALLMWSLNQGK